MWLGLIQRVKKNKTKFIPVDSDIFQFGTP